MDKKTLFPSSVFNTPTFESKNFIDNDFAILEDINDVSVNNYPIQTDAAFFALCLQGTLRLGINLKEYEMKPDDLMIIMPDSIIHRYGKSSNFSGIFIVVSRSFMEDTLPKFENVLPFFFYVKENPCTPLEKEEVECIREYHSFLLKKVKMNRNFYRKEIALNLLQAFFYDVCNIFKRHLPKEEKRKSRKDEIFTRFLQLVTENVRENRSVSFYADKLCLTPKYLSGVVNEVSGKSAGEWIDNYAVLAAKVLLKSTRKTIQEIAAELHFANQSFFGKYFKHHTGQSPRKYRNS